ncbi:uncharacterized protein LOC133914241 isoform X1 [Phragmites australis]|uniref:uncharacterized protein LOC133914241 isoform X1 n=1 Tax=Phragmites australis TaxID=29695 RepID=UPI002D78FBCD|nr:uncharacterized protein LOC133914241 isoform X1 [Phragmites australis]
MEHVVDEERPHSEEAYAEYLSWFMPRTRILVMYTLAELPWHVANMHHTYLTHWDLARSFERDILHRIDVEARAMKLQLNSGLEVSRGEMSVVFVWIIWTVVKVFRSMSYSSSSDVMTGAQASSHIPVRPFATFIEPPHSLVHPTFAAELSRISSTSTSSSTPTMVSQSFVVAGGTWPRLPLSGVDEPLRN